MRRRIDPTLNAAGRRLALAGVTANAVTAVAFLVGAGASLAIALHAFWLGLALIVLSRLGDGLDGAVARASPDADGAFGTDLGGYLDIVLDFAFYGLVPLGFVLADPAANGIAGAVLLAAFYFNGASFLAFATLAEKRGVTETGPKAFLYTVGLMEGTETILFFCLLCLVPDWFAVLAYTFAALTLVTTAARIGLAVRTFG